MQILTVVAKCPKPTVSHFLSSRKRPKVSSGRASSHVTPPVLLSPIKSGAASLRSADPSVKSTSKGPPTLKNRQHSGHGAKLSSFSVSAGAGTGKMCNTYGQDCGSAAKKPSEGFRYETEKDAGAIKRQSSSPHHHTSRNGRRPARQKAEPCEHKTLAPKRKGEPQLISSSLSKTVKCQRFPSAGSSGTSLGARKLNQNPKERVS